MAESHVVFGATGHVGGIVAARLLEAGKRVKVVARTADRLKPLASKGAEVAAGSVEDGAFLRRTLEGAEAAFVLLPPYLGQGVRAFQDRVSAALGDALEATRVPRSLALSSIGADQAAGNGPIAGLHVLEQRLARIPGHSPLLLRPGFFFENNLAWIGMIKGMGMVGSALRGDLKMAQIATRDIGEAAARRLLALDWKGTTVQELQGERDLSMNEAAAIVGKAIGKPELKYVQFPYPDALQGMVKMGLSQEMAELYVDMSKGFNEGKTKATQPRTAATTTLTSFEKFVAEVFVPAFRAG
jgi:uncharacterized protein YbjT (DUF2867 family)